MTELAPLIETWGAPGLIAVLAVLYARSERAERIRAQEQERETYREILPGLEALKEATRIIGSRS